MTDNVINGAHVLLRQALRLQLLLSLRSNSCNREIVTDCRRLSCERHRLFDASSIPKPQRKLIYVSSTLVLHECKVELEKSLPQF